MSARVLSGYYELTKPGITLFIGTSAAAGFITATGGWGQPVRLAIALLATMLMSGGAAALNHLAERTGDARMRRTAGRPIPSGMISPRNAGLFGWSLSAVGFVISVSLLPWPATVFLVLSHVSYVYLYTPLKRRTAFCTLAGAIPGALPVLAGWTAAGVPINGAALALTGVLFMWQIPHFLAIGCLGREDYERAGCVLLNIVEPTGRSSARVSFMYAFAMLVCVVMLGLSAPIGALYAAIAGTTAAGYVLFAWRFVREPERLPARRLFFSSLLVLPLVLGALVADLLLPF
ncbi:MAG: heme o synthase [Gemmatimonadetes bacterium]|nr:heme o synthase [Gemmatimonadota bacterium]